MGKHCAPVAEQPGLCLGSLPTFTGYIDTVCVTGNANMGRGCGHVAFVHTEAGCEMCKFIDIRDGAWLQSVVGDYLRNQLTSGGDLRTFLGKIVKGEAIRYFRDDPVYHAKLRVDDGGIEPAPGSFEWHKRRSHRGAWINCITLRAPAPSEDQERPRAVDRVPQNGASRECTSAVLCV